MRFFKLISLSISVCLCSASAWGLAITTQKPGTLSEALKDAETVTDLTVSGPIDATDLYYIGRNMPGVVTLDLSGAEILASRGLKIDGYTDFSLGTLPPGVFSGTSLRSVILPSQAGLVIGDGAFMGSAIVNVTIPANVDSIGLGAFSGCESLENVTLSACRMGKSVFSDCPVLETVNIGSATTIPAATFKRCAGLSSVKGSEKITYIGDEAFAGDVCLTDFAFGNRLTYIGTDAFTGSGLKTANLKDAAALIHLGEHAFAGTPVEEVTLPNKMEIIADGLFFNSTSLKAITVPAQVYTIGAFAFAQTGLSEVLLSEGLSEIGDYAMANATDLQHIDAVALEKVPSLGQDVWIGVDQPSVLLSVFETVADEFAADEQWSKFTFDIRGDRDAVNDLETHNDIEGRFVGDNLYVRSEPETIDEVRLYDIAGRHLVRLNPQTTTVTVDTSDFDGNIFIINVKLNNGDTATLKLARR